MGTNRTSHEITNKERCNNTVGRTLINNQHDSQKAHEILSYHDSSKEKVIIVLSLLKIHADNEATIPYCQFNL